MYVYVYLTLRFLNIPAATFRLRWTSFASASETLLKSQTRKPVVRKLCKVSYKTIQTKTCMYFSFPACLEANLVYQMATLKAMETSSKIASCWALRWEQEEGWLYRMIYATKSTILRPKISSKEQS